MNDYYAGGFLHADDIRTLSTSIDSLEVQVSAVHDFARNNFLKLNFQKCEIIPFSCDASHSGIPTCKMDNATLPVVANAKCLGYCLTNSVLVDADAVSERVIKKTLRGIDKEKLVEKCHKKSPAIANIINRGGCWPKLWDIALHLGPRHITGLRNLSRLMAHHGHGQQPCPLCSEQTSESQLLTTSCVYTIKNLDSTSALLSRC